MENKKSILGHFIAIGSGAFLNLIIGLLTSPIITRLVDPSEYGMLSIFNMYANECVVLGFIGNNNVFTGYKKLVDGELSEVKINKVELAKSILRHKAKAIMIAHNHPLGKASPC